MIILLIVKFLLSVPLLADFVILLINPSTKVYNRYAFLNAAEEALRNGNTTMFVVKLPNLQYYNTTSGVKYTGRMLLEIAEYLDNVSADFHCYDFDNGRFALLGYGESSADHGSSF